MGSIGFFKVPKKWIYPLPADPSPPPGCRKKHFILVVEKIKTKKGGDNWAEWRSSSMSYERMEALYTLLDELGLIDSLFPDNVPFTKNGKQQAFIDTEHFNGYPVNFDKLSKYFSTEKRCYWKKLIKDGAEQHSMRKKLLYQP